MFPRVVECLSIVGRSKRAGSKPEHEVLPVFQKQPGFVDFLTLSDKTTPAGDIEDDISEGLRFLQFGTSKLTSKEVPEIEIKNRLNLDSERRPRNAPARGAICKRRSNKVIQLLSICRDDCIYVYVALGDPKSEIHGSLIGLNRRDLLEAGFIFVAEDWNGSQRKGSDMRVQAIHIHPPNGSIEVSSGGATELDD